MTSEPRLAAYLKYIKPKRFTLKGYKTAYFVCRGCQLLSWKNPEEATHQPNQPALAVSLKGCEVLPDVNIGTGRYGIRLSVPSTDGMNDLHLRCDSEAEYAQWMAACRVGSKGKDLSDVSYQQVSIKCGLFLDKKCLHLIELYFRLDVLAACTPGDNQQSTLYP